MPKKENRSARSDRGSITQPSANIIFKIKDKVVIRIEDNGDFFVNEKKVANDREVFEAFKLWIFNVGIDEVERMQRLIDIHGWGDRFNE